MTSAKTGGCANCFPLCALENGCAGVLAGRMLFLGKPVTGVVFDMDGLLLDTERVSMRAWQAGARLHGIEVPDAVFLDMIGHRNADCLAILRRFAGREIPEEAIAAAMYADYDRRLAAGVPLMRGAAGLVSWLAGAGLPLAVATSTHRELACKKLAKAGLLDFFRCVIGGDDVARGKPAPDVYLAAVGALGLAAEGCVAFEDSSPGALAAAAAGLRVVAVPDLKEPSEEARRAAVAVVPGLEEVGRWFEGGG